MYDQEGVSVFFNGMNAKMSQTVTNSAFMFLIYEKLVGIILLALIKTFPSTSLQLNQPHVAKPIVAEKTNT